jgi:hypothetical protein
VEDGVCGSGQACRKALPMYKELKGACRVGTKGFADFLGGAGSVMLTMGMLGTCVCAALCVCVGGGRFG